ncbi:MAG: response regulator transcription factor [Acidobacteria bacterium]|nr:response regulator transcription factor [Acidobacteriota bacterium]MCW5967107.1 response regulator transcription factor [Blastocatellales bacterium]
MPGKVLIVEDDHSMAVALRDGFEYEGYSVQVARDGADGLRLASERDADLIILDVMLPKISGFDVCKQLRSSGNATPIIMLTARGQEIDKVVGLRIGADDYVTKPFSFMELLARVEALLRRTHKHNDSTETFSFGDVSVNFRKFEVTRSGSPVELSPREFKILKYFIEHRGEVISRDQLLDAVWGYGSFPLTRTVDMHIAKLRHKIENTPGDPHHIITVHRIGYKFIV